MSIHPKLPWGWSERPVTESGMDKVRPSEVSALEAKLDRAMLACEAMWTLLREKLKLDDLELADRINALDLSDGRLDGRVRRPPVSCPSCKRTLSPRMAKCLYCGQEIVQDCFQ